MGGSGFLRKGGSVILGEGLLRGGGSFLGRNIFCNYFSCVFSWDCFFTSMFFFQARPVDYAREYLQSQNSVSFHKHWMIDPLYVYEKWLSEVELQRKDVEHNEL